MGQPWTILTQRWGHDVREPSVAELKVAIWQLYFETMNGELPDAHYAEHGAAWLRHGYEEGPMYLLEIDRNRRVRFEESADQDFEREAAPPQAASNVSEESAIRLWSWLAAGEVDRVRAFFRMLPSE
jgi:hypothetical protein